MSGVDDVDLLIPLCRNPYSDRQEVPARGARYPHSRLRSRGLHPGLLERVETRAPQSRAGLCFCVSHSATRSYALSIRLESSTCTATPIQKNSQACILRTDLWSSCSRSTDSHPASKACYTSVSSTRHGVSLTTFVLSIIVDLTPLTLMQSARKLSQAGKALLDARNFKELLSVSCCACIL